MDAQTAVRIHTDNSPEMTHLSVWIPTDNNTIQPNPGVVQFPPPPSTVMDRVTDRVRDRVRDRDMGRVRDRVRLRGLAIAAPSYSGP